MLTYNTYDSINSQNNMAGSQRWHIFNHKDFVSALNVSYFFVFKRDACHTKKDVCPLNGADEWVDGPPAQINVAWRLASTVHHFFTGIRCRSYSPAFLCRLSSIVFIKFFQIIVYSNSWQTVFRQFSTFFIITARGMQYLNFLLLFMICWYIRVTWTCMYQIKYSSKLLSIL